MRMKRYLVGATAATFAVLLLCGAGLRAAQSQGSSAATGSSAAIAQQKALVDQYCVTCHNQKTKTAGLALDTLDLTKVSEHADIWEKAIMKLRGRSMPPPNARQPQPE